MTSDPDERFTPRALVSELHAKHRFSVDAASHPESPAAQIIGKHWTKEQDGLKQAWRGQRIFVNPPFSELSTWVAKADSEVRDNGCPLVVMLLPATRTEQPWWQKYVEPVRDSSAGIVRTRFLRGRTRFGQPGDPEGEQAGSPPFGCVLVIWEGMNNLAPT